jgi:hypothetical protein
MSDTPLDPIITGTKRAAIHFTRAAFEIAAGMGALLVGVTETIRPPDDTDDESGVEHVPVE